MTEKELAKLNEKLTVLSNLLAYQITKGMTVAEGAPILSKLGLSRAEIATILDSTPNAINVRLAEAKKKSSKKAA